MSRTRSYAIVSIFIIAAIITPTGDALTLCMLAAPMTLLYEACIWFAYFTRKKELQEEAEEREKQTPRIAAAPGSLAALEAEENHFADEGEELDDGVIEGEDSPSQLDKLRAPYDPHATSDVDHDFEENHFEDDHFDHAHFEEDESLEQGTAVEDIHLTEAAAKLEELRAKIKELEENALSEEGDPNKGDDAHKQTEDPDKQN